MASHFFFDLVSVSNFSVFWFPSVQDSVRALGVLLDGVHCTWAWRARAMYGIRVQGV